VPDIGRREIEERVQARMQRQELLTKERPLRVWAVVDEAVIRRLVGGRQVMREQLSKLLEVADEPHITFQLLPYDAGAHPGMPGSFAILQYDASNPDLIYIENAATDLFLEDESDISRYTMVFEHLRAVAASPEATRRILADAIEDLR
jgi:hypothetical protein